MSSTCASSASPKPKLCKLTPRKHAPAVWPVCTHRYVRALHGAPRLGSLYGGGRHKQALGRTGHAAARARARRRCCCRRHSVKENVPEVKKESLSVSWAASEEPMAHNSPTSSRDQSKPAKRSTTRRRLQRPIHSVRELSDVTNVASELVS
jgi:hypothetical protein